MKIIKIFIPVMLLVFLYTGCDLIENEKPASVAELNISISNLPTIADTSSEYNLWVVSSTGTNTKIVNFNTDVSGNYNAVITPKTGPIQSGTQFVVTIERKVTATDTVKLKMSKSIVLSGNIVINSCDLASGSGGVLYPDSVFAGQFTISTPTAGLLNGDQGIWYTKSLADTSLGLSIPSISGTGWVYQSWLLKDNVLYKMGEFYSPAGKDQDSTYSGLTRLALLVPGEDFVTNVPSNTLIKGAKVFITMQPTSISKENRNTPYWKVLEADIPSNVAGGNTIQMNKVTHIFPSGKITLKLQI